VDFEDWALPHTHALSLEFVSAKPRELIGVWHIHTPTVAKQVQRADFKDI
jgi:hypothetical protein